MAGGARRKAVLPAVHRFTLRTLQREIGSSPAAVRPPCMHWPSARRWPPIARRCWTWPTAPAASDPGPRGRRWSSLLLSQLAADGREKLIIFTHFRATLELLADICAQMGVDFVLYQAA